MQFFLSESELERVRYRWESVQTILEQLFVAMRRAIDETNGLDSSSFSALLHAAEQMLYDLGASRQIIDQIRSQLYEIEQALTCAEFCSDPFSAARDSSVPGMSSAERIDEGPVQKRSTDPADCDSENKHESSGGTADAGTPQIEISKVYFSALAPKQLTKGEYSIIDILMYDESCRNVVDELLAESEDPLKETKSGLHKVAADSSVRVVLTSPDLEMEDNEETATWCGEHLHFNFAVFLPEHYDKKQVLFTASVYINDLIATRLKFVAKCSSLREQKMSVEREDVLSAFVSYASQDRSRVAVLIQGMKKARPDMDIFFDVDSLRSGENWESALIAEIEQRDILFLCWSQSARKSKWVDLEWRYAFRKKGAECIEPIPIDPPGECPPPDELKQKHFHDKMLYIINSNQ